MSSLLVVVVEGAVLRVLPLECEWNASFRVAMLSRKLKLSERFTPEEEDCRWEVDSAVLFTRSVPSRRLHVTESPTCLSLRDFGPGRCNFTKRDITPKPKVKEAKEKNRH